MVSLYNAPAVNGAELMGLKNAQETREKGADVYAYTLYKVNKLKWVN